MGLGFNHLERRLYPFILLGHHGTYFKNGHDMRSALCLFEHTNCIRFGEPHTVYGKSRQNLDRICLPS